MVRVMDILKAKEGLDKVTQCYPAICDCYGAPVQNSLKMSHLPDFKFHPMCKTLCLNHLIFADNLMIFCKGDQALVTRVVEALQHFSHATGLKANLDKSSMFLAGADEQTKQVLLAQTCFTLGTFPIRYLGLSSSSKKWSKMECHQLVKKLTNKINVSYSRQLSYAGKLQVINAILFSIFNFWGTMFILPRGILKEVDQKCKSYLRCSSTEKKKVALVAWEKVCVPKRFGGLNIKSSRRWNMTFVGRLVWQLALKKDVLWLKWVNGLYMRNQNDI
uniref:Reverse transcriptase domain-containing protein n=1 Tax=Nicotiana tabacum TaxID=4097 RepID=A0A1S3Z786_TOBAC|nr:PREDICTED: uncharacterized protein LOC107783765 [Nicotiana tabacum]